MPANFQKAFDYTLSIINLAHTFLDDIIIINKRSLSDHERETDKVLVRLDNKKLAVSLQKCEFARTEQKWLGYKINLKGIISKEKKKKRSPNWNNHIYLNNSDRSWEAYIT